MHHHTPEPLYQPATEQQRLYVLLKHLDDMVRCSECGAIGRRHRRGVHWLSGEMLAMAEERRQKYVAAFE